MNEQDQPVLGKWESLYQQAAEAEYPCTLLMHRWNPAIDPAYIALYYGAPDSESTPIQTEAVMRKHLQLWELGDDGRGPSYEMEILPLDEAEDRRLELVAEYERRLKEMGRTRFSSAAAEARWQTAITRRA